MVFHISSTLILEPISIQIPVGSYAMAYGSLKNYEVAIFSPVEIAKSNDYKFKQGIISYKGISLLGGNVVGYQGFVRVKKSEKTEIENPEDNG